MPMSKMLWYTDMFCTIYKPEKNTANKLTKDWNWPFLIFHH